VFSFGQAVYGCHLQEPWKQGYLLVQAGECDQTLYSQDLKYWATCTQFKTRNVMRIQWPSAVHT